MAPTPVTDQVRDRQGDYLAAVEDMETQHGELLAALTHILGGHDLDPECVQIAHAAMHEVKART